MEKGVEISFQLNGGREDVSVVEALANLTGNFFSSQIEVEWRIFHVTLGENLFYKVLYTGKTLNRLHPRNENDIKRKFDELAHLDYSELMKEYEVKSREPGFRKIPVKELKEEYDLWQDKLWNYI